MNSDASGARLEPNDTPLQSIAMGRFQLAPEFQHLENAPIGEFETSETTVAASASTPTETVPATEANSA